MDLGIRLIFHVDHGSRTDEPASGCGRVDEHLVYHIFIVDGLGQIEFPDPEERCNLLVLRFLVLRHQARAKREHYNHYAYRFPGHFHPPHWYVDPGDTTQVLPPIQLSEAREK